MENYVEGNVEMREEDNCDETSQTSTTAVASENTEAVAASNQAVTPTTLWPGQHAMQRKKSLSVKGHRKCRQIVWGVFLSILVTTVEQWFHVPFCLSYQPAVPTIKSLLACFFHGRMGVGEELHHPLVPYKKRSKRTQLSFSKDDNGKPASSSLLSAPTRLPVRSYQQRIERKPSYYWENVENIDRELRQLWTSVLIPHGSTADETAEILERYLPSHQPPPIPSYSILRYWKRTDIYGLIQRKGFEELSDMLGGAKVIPGKWADAVKLEIVQQVIVSDDNLTTKATSQTKRSKRSGNGEWEVTPKKLLTQQKPNGYWNKATIISTLYEFLEKRKQEENIPSVWMPILYKEFKMNGLATGMRTQFGGVEDLSKAAGLVPIHEWTFFERQYELMLLLQDYCNENMNRDYSIFPRPIDRTRNSQNSRLCRLITDFGGTKMLASRFGMEYSGVPGSRNNMLNMDRGPFDLETAIDLMDFVRAKQMQKTPPLDRTEISMPTQSELLEGGNGSHGQYLHQQIESYGGYESVARRLGLAWRGTKL